MPTPPTLTITINALVGLLQQRLAETTGVYWAPSELVLYIRQAIREFQVLTGYWRSRIQVSTVASQPFYDLSSADPQLAYTVTDLNILAQVGYQILETGVPPFVSTSQFALATLTDALDQRREELFGETRMVVSEYTPAVGTPANGRVVLPSGVLQVHRADWQDGTTDLWSRLERTDEIGGYGWAFNWPATPGPPQAYSVAVVPPFVLQLIPGPSNSGNLDLLLTECEPYTYTGSGQLLGFPDDASFALPWGIMASILSQDSQSRDFQRSGYALARWNMALEILKTYPLVMQVGIGLSPQIQPATMQGLDAWLPGWRNQTPAQPTTIAVAGRNLVAMAPIPDTVYNATMDCIVNSPASGSASATVAVPGDIVSALLDNGYHLAVFKMGGEEFTGTLPMYQNFTKTAQKYASRERAEAINFEALRSVTEFENQQMPFEETAK
jgi:hypothetical protein